MRSLRSLPLLFVLALALPGCGLGQSTTEDLPAADPNTWESTVSFGYRGDKPIIEGKFEPLVALTTLGEPDATAMVFVSVIDGEATLIEEVATVYEPGGTAGIYTSGPLELPKGTEQCTLRYRIVSTPGGEETIQDVAVDLKK